MTEQNKGKLNLLELYCIGLGQVIGAGVVSLVGVNLNTTGWSVWLAFLLAIIYGFLIVFPTIMLCGTVRVRGGNYSVVAGLTQNKKLAGMMAVSSLSYLIIVSLFVTSLGTYIVSLAPGTQPYIKLIEIAILTLFFALNMLGVNVMARIQKYMVYVLIAALLLFIIWGCANFNNPIFDFSNPQFLLHGREGLWTATLSLEYCCTGYNMLISFSDKAAHPTRDIPKAMLLCVPSLIVLYVGVAIADSCVLPLEQVAGQPLTYTAFAVFPKVLAYAFVIGGPIMALLTTLNSAIPANAVSVVRACENGFLPRSLADKNKHGVAWKVMLIFWVIGVLPILLNFSVSTITNDIQLLISLNSFIGCYAMWQLPKRFPGAWKKSRYHMPDGLYHFFVLLTFALQMIILVNKIHVMNTTIVIVSSAAIAVCFIIGIIRSKDPSIDISAASGNLMPD